MLIQESRAVQCFAKLLTAHLSEPSNALRVAWFNAPLAHKANGALNRSRGAFGPQAFSLLEHAVAAQAAQSDARKA